MAKRVHKKRGFSFRNISRNFSAFVNVVFAVVFLVACFQHLLPPRHFWFIGYLGIGFPYILLVLMAFMIFWMFSKNHRRYFLISGIAILLGIQQTIAIFGFHEPAFTVQKEKGNIRIMTWNVMGFYGLKPGFRQQEMNADRMLQKINEYKPDILCLQEYAQTEKVKRGKTMLSQIEALGYRHHVLSKDYTRASSQFSGGLAIFSKYPFVSTRRSPYTSSPESLLSADVSIGKDTFRIMTTHLQSYRFSSQELDQIERIKDNEKPSIPSSRSLLSKMKTAFVNRAAQVDQAVPVIEESPYRQIVCVDLNDVPNSYAYWKLRGPFNDLFLKKGFGIGRTYISLAPTLRIDYIFAHPEITVDQLTILNERLSDHLPVVADIQLQP